MSCLVLIVAAALSWAVTCMLWMLISACFGFEFSLLTATGIWLVIALVRFAFSDNGRSK